MQQVVSKDGTIIAYERSGNGPPVIFVNGALSYMGYHGDRELANELSRDFTVVIYDRRGRGESTDTLPYAVEREIEDIEALIDIVGGKAYLYGISSGAVLALKAAVKLKNKVTKLAIYEPPWTANITKEEFDKDLQHMNSLLAAGRYTDVIAYFMANSMTPEMIEDFRKNKANEWKIMEALAPTLAYDYAVLGFGMTPVEAAKLVMVPTLVMNGSEGLQYIYEDIENIAHALQNGQRKTLKGQTHEPSAKAMAPVLTAFFKD